MNFDGFFWTNMLIFHHVSRAEGTNRNCGKVKTTKFFTDILKGFACRGKDVHRALRLKRVVYFKAWFRIGIRFCKRPRA